MLRYPCPAEVSATCVMREYAGIIWNRKEFLLSPQKMICKGVLIFVTCSEEINVSMYRVKEGCDLLGTVWIVVGGENNLLFLY